MHWVVATKRPNTFSMASETSPTVARARMAVDAGRQQVAAAFGGLGDAVQGAARGRIVAIGFEPVDHAGDLFVAHLVRDFQHVHLGIFVELVFVDADDDIQPLVDAGLFAGRRLFDTQFGHAGFDGLGHAAQLFHLVDDRAGFFDDAVGQGSM
jgi:hypothetical protein